MSISKSRISSPLEAGTSILDVDHLPDSLHGALEYASARLARRSMHVSLVLVRRDYQLPRASPSPLPTPTPTHTQTPCERPDLARQTSPLSPRLALASFRRLVSLPGSASPSAKTPWESPLPSPCTAAGPDADPRLRPLASHPTWPASPRTPLSPPPMTPLLTASSSAASTDATHEARTPHPFGIRLVYADLLTDRQKVTVRHVFERAEKKFRIGPGWLPAPLDPVSCGLPAAVAARSLVRNDALFSSDGLTLVPLDRLYTFKAALASYSRTLSPLRLEDAVDELRRLVLARKGAGVPRAEVARWYDWLGFSDDALAAVDRMYRRAYGGAAGAAGVEGLVVAAVAGRGARAVPRGVGGGAAPPEGESEVETDFETDSVGAEPSRERQEAQDVGGATAKASPSPKTAPSPKTSPSPKTAAPALKLQTQFPSRPAPPARDTGVVTLGLSSFSPASDVDEDDGAVTARPGRESGRTPWSPATIAEVLHEQAALGGGRARRRGGATGPMTPNGYDDISPITRGEWGFLMGDGGVRQGMKTAAVVTW